MKVYKFGGASVRDITCINHVADILRGETEPVILVVSAMGKTTNRLEKVVAALAPQDYDRMYDQIVSNGELWSSRVVYKVLRQRGIDIHWVDMTRVLRTDSTYRAANVDFEATSPLLRAAVAGHHHVILQGFIGADAAGYRTTLGREGSDYTAAIVANLLNADSVTLWKDVPGVMTGDPKVDPTARRIERLTYAEAEAMSKAGAQIIHPKTMAPLAEKCIPLYVKPFWTPDESGTVIC